MNQQELLWRQYDKHIELYRFYLELVVKINAFHFAISGAIFSFYFANKKEPDIQWVIALPAIMSISLALLFAYGAWANLISRKDVISLRDKMDLKVSPELMFLTVFLVFFCVVNLLTFGGALYVFCSYGT